MAKHLFPQQEAAPVAVAGNGLLDRRLFLKGGAAFAAAITGYTLTDAAAAQALADDPWSRVAGNLVTDYGVWSVWGQVLQSDIQPVAMYECKT